MCINNIKNNYILYGCILRKINIDIFKKYTFYDTYVLIIK